jgi:excisionase family DNA binding protein
MKKYTVIEAAAELGVSRNLVYLLCQSRKIRHERHGLGKGKIVIPADALEEYRERVSVTVTPEGEEVLPPRVSLRDIKPCAR